MNALLSYDKIIKDSDKNWKVNLKVKTNQTTEIKVYTRFPKIVTLINKNDKYWLDIIKRVIETYTSIWGGDLNLIIPFTIKERKIHIDEPFLSLLRNYDPDIVLIYAYSGYDIKKFDRNDFKEHLRFMKEIHIKDGIDLDEKEIRKLAEQNIDIRNFSFYQSFVENLKLEDIVFPLYSIDDRFDPEIYVFRSNRIPHHFLNNLFLKYDIWKRKIENREINLYIPYLKDKFYNLLLFSIIGKFPTEDFIKLNDNLIKDKLQCNPILNYRNRFIKIVYDEFETKIENKIELSDFLKSFFLSYDNFQFKKDRKYTFNFNESPFYIIIGSKEDIDMFLIYFNLLRLGFNVVYFPIEILKRDEDNFINELFLKNLILCIFEYQYFEEFKIVSKSNIDTKEFQNKLITFVEEFNKDIKFLLRKEELQKNILKSNFTYENYLDIFKNIQVKDRSFQSTPFYAQIDEENKIILDFNFFKSAYLSEELDITNLVFDMEIKDFSLIQKKEIFKKVIKNEDIINYRYYIKAKINKNGNLSIWFKRLVPSGNIKFIRKIDYESYFKYFISDNLIISDKGIYTKLTIENSQLGLNQILDLIFDKEFKWVIPTFVVKAGLKAKHYIPYFPDNIIESISKYGLKVKEERRTILTVEDFKNIYGKINEHGYEENKLINYLNKLIEHNILELGYFLTCRYCFQNWFYTLSEIKDENNFKCIYCRKDQKIILENFRENTPIVVFSLRDYVFKLFSQNGDLPLLTLYWIIRNLNPKNIIWSPELKSKGERDEFEIDMIASFDGKLAIGECKKTNNGFKNLENFYKAVENLKPDFVFLSTFDDNVSILEEIKQEIENKNKFIKVYTLGRESFKKLF